MISNPYAKKRSRAPHVAAAVTAPRSPSMGTASASVQSTTRDPVSNRPQNVAATSEYVIPLPAAATFSQAFESVEPDGVFPGPLLRSNRDGAGPQRTEQQAEGQSAAAAGESSASIETAALPPQMSDRDHHVFLQQPHVLYVSVKQRGNGVLEYIRNVPLQYQKMVPDYIFSSTSCALFLSLRYHNLYRDYIDRRIAELRTDFTLRVLLVLVDVDDSTPILLVLNKLAVQQDLTLILAWSEEEAARYLETFKALDGKDAASIQKNKDVTGKFADQVTDYLTTCKGINKTDAASVLTQFGSVRAAMAATPDELGLISGLGEVKVKRLHDAFHKPFSSKAARLRKQKLQDQLDREASLRVEREHSDDECDDEENEFEGDEADAS